MPQPDPANLPTKLPPWVKPAVLEYKGERQHVDRLPRGHKKLLAQGRLHDFETIRHGITYYGDIAFVLAGRGAVAVALLGQP